MQTGGIGRRTRDQRKRTKEAKVVKLSLIFISFVYRLVIAFEIFKFL